jgi:hypothetical protein
MLQIDPEPRIKSILVKTKLQNYTHYSDLRLAFSAKLFQHALIHSFRAVNARVFIKAVDCCSRRQITNGVDVDRVFYSTWKTIFNLS